MTNIQKLNKILSTYTVESENAANITLLCEVVNSLEDKEIAGAHRSFLEEQFKLFTTRLKAIAEETLGNVESDFLPYLESDTYSNVQTKAQQIIEDFLSNKRQSPHLHDWMTPARANEVRNKMFEDHKEEIIAAIEKDLIKDRDFWKSEVEFMRKHRY